MTIFGPLKLKAPKAVLYDTRGLKARKSVMDCPVRQSELMRILVSLPSIEALPTPERMSYDFQTASHIASTA
jgi:hypothetical protein